MRDTVDVARKLLFPARLVRKGRERFFVNLTAELYALQAGQKAI